MGFALGGCEAGKYFIALSLKTLGGESVQGWVMDTLVGVNLVKQFSAFCDFETFCVY